MIWPAAEATFRNRNVEHIAKVCDAAVMTNSPVFIQDVVIRGGSDHARPSTSFSKLNSIEGNRTSIVFSSRPSLRTFSFCEAPQRPEFLGSMSNMDMATFGPEPLSRVGSGRNNEDRQAEFNACSGVGFFGPDAIFWGHHVSSIGIL